MRRLILLLLAGVSGVRRTLAFAGDAHDGSMVGTWMFKVTFPGLPDFRYLQTFNADGITTLVLPDPFPLGPDGRTVVRSASGTATSPGRMRRESPHCLESSGAGRVVGQDLVEPQASAGTEGTCPTRTFSAELVAG